MNNYYLQIFCDLKGSDPDLLINDVIIIKGKTGIDALKKYFNKNFIRTSDRNCDIILTKCKIKDDNKLLLIGNTCGYNLN